MKEEIRIINKIIFEAIVHGGDPGGPYYINEEDLLASMYRWINFRGLSEEYGVGNMSISTDHGVYHYIPQIVRRL